MEPPGEIPRLQPRNVREPLSEGTFDVESVQKKLKALDSGQASGPDGM